MKNYHRVVEKFLSLSLSLSLLLPGSVFAQFSARIPARAPAPVGARYYPVNMPDVAAKKMAASPVLSAAQETSFAAAPSPVVSRHPVLDIINQIQEAGISLPEKANSASDASQLIAAARSLKPGPARDHILAMARVLSTPSGAGTAGGKVSSGLDEVYENGASRSSTDAPLPAVQAQESKGLLAALSRYSRLPKSWRARLADKIERDRIKAEPLNPELFKVPLEKLRWTPDLKTLPKSTKDVSDGGNQIVGQEKALKALYFGLKMTGDNYNLYVSGPEGSGRETAVRQVTDNLAATMPTPPDQAAATNFANKNEPIVLRLAAGSAPAFKSGVKGFVKKCRPSCRRRSIPEKSAKSKKNFARNWKNRCADAWRRSTRKSPKFAWKISGCPFVWRALKMGRSSWSRPHGRENRSAKRR